MHYWHVLLFCIVLLFLGSAFSFSPQHAQLSPAFLEASIPTSKETMLAYFKGCAQLSSLWIGSVPANLQSEGRGACNLSQATFGAHEHLVTSCVETCVRPMRLERSGLREVDIVNQVQGDWGFTGLVFVVRLESKSEEHFFVFVFFALIPETISQRKQVSGKTLCTHH